MERFMAQFWMLLGAEVVTGAICIGGIWAFFRSLRKIGSTQFAPAKATAFWVIAVTSLLNVAFPPAAAWAGISCLILFLVSIPVLLVAGPIKKRRENSTPRQTDRIANQSSESATDR